MPCMVKYDTRYYCAVPRTSNLPNNNITPPAAASQPASQHNPIQAEKKNQKFELSFLSQSESNPIQNQDDALYRERITSAIYVYSTTAASIPSRSIKKEEGKKKGGNHSATKTTILTQSFLILYYPILSHPSHTKLQRVQ